MTSPQKIHDAIQRVNDEASFIQEFLIDALGWPIADDALRVDAMSYGWSAEELKAQALESVLEGVLRQIVLRGNPWGIFILEFSNPDVFLTGRGMTGILRKVLRGLVPKKRAIRDPHLASFNRENLLFICTHAYEHFTFSYFKSAVAASGIPKIASFGWGPGSRHAIRTLCEYNLRALGWPDQELDQETWVKSWSEAFDVEKVTKQFFEDYSTAFESVEQIIGENNQLNTEDLRLATQGLFNRLMFLRFVERKGWLKSPGQQETNYLAALMGAGPIGRRSFFESRLKPLFFEGLAIPGRQDTDAYGSVPFLNGGLFEETELDRKIEDVPYEAFRRIIGPDGLFYRYNFTIEESTPFDIEVAVDPEMLGKVFEELVTGRHETGSYYTPRPVVSFMCREALKAYLTERTQASGVALATLVDQQDAAQLTETHAREILTALDSLKAVDPACGSGAYLLGLMHEMIAVYRLLYTDKIIRDARSLYELKLRIIAHNLYGVDIDPFATNVAMLRLWLSLAVEADQPVALPNLDFRIETGDSLLAPDPHDARDIFRANVVALADEANRRKNDYLTATGIGKEAIRKQLEKLQQSLARELEIVMGPGLVDWRVQFAEIFTTNAGFDLLLMNPPYVATYSRQSEKRVVSAEGRLRQAYGMYGGRLNLFTCFVIRALQLVCKEGVVAFIVPDSYATSDSYKVIREAYAERFRNHSWTLIKPPVFGASVRNVIVIAGPGEAALRAVVVAKERQLGTILKLHAAAHTTVWGTAHRIAFFGSVLEQEIWQKVSQKPLKIADFFDTKDGVNPGARAVRDRLLDPPEGAAHVRPLIEGSHIDPTGFRLRPSHRTILYDQHAITRAEKRAGSSLRDPRVFLSPKVVSRQTADTLIAAIDLDRNYVALNSVHCTRSLFDCVEHLWGLVALLNSPLGRLYYAIDGGETRDLLPQVHISWLRNLPLPERADALLRELGPLAKQIYETFDHGSARRRALARVHAVVCQAYEMDDEQCKAALSSYLRRYKRFQADW